MAQVSNTNNGIKSKNMESKKAQELIKLRCCNKYGSVVYDLCADEVVKIVEAAESEIKEKAIDAFSQFVKDYCLESGREDIHADAEHYIGVFKELINK